jgi:hypothetical protein
MQMGSRVLINKAERRRRGKESRDKSRQRQDSWGCEMFVQQLASMWLYGSNKMEEEVRAIAPAERD